MTSLAFSVPIPSRPCLHHLNLSTAPPSRPAPTAVAAGPPLRRFRLPSPCSTVASLYSPPRPLSPLLQGGGGGNRGTGGGSGPGRGRGGGDDASGWGGSDSVSPASHLLSLLSQLFRSYNASLAAAPLATKAASSGVLVMLSDAVAQALSGSGSSPDVLRLARHFFYGMLIAGPQGHYWFKFLEQAVRLPGVRGVLAKLALDQLAFSPVVTAGFFGIMKVGEGWSMGSAGSFVKDNLGDTMIQSWKVWPVVNAVNFAVVPPPHRVVFTSAVSVFWIAFLSLVANGEGQEAVTASAVMTGFE